MLTTFSISSFSGLETGEGGGVRKKKNKDLFFPPQSYPRWPTKNYQIHTLTNQFLGLPHESVVFIPAKECVSLQRETNPKPNQTKKRCWQSCVHELKAALDTHDSRI